jgi:hypothetical protein
MPIYDNSPHFGLQITAGVCGVESAAISTSGKNSLAVPDLH